MVIAIIGLLISLLLPAVQSAREAARRTSCSNNLRQIGLALHNYHSAHRTFPPGCLGKRNPSSDKTKPQLAWSLLILPQMEQANVYAQFDTSKGYDDPANHEAASTVIPNYICPSTTRYHGERRGSRTEDGLGAIDYGGMFGRAMTSPVDNGCLIWERGIPFSAIRDGTTNTIIVAEDTGRGAGGGSMYLDGQWANGENIFEQGKKINLHANNEMFSDHPGGAQTLLADGSVHFLSDSIDEQTLGALCTRAKGEVVDQSAF